MYGSYHLRVKTRYGPETRRPRRELAVTIETSPPQERLFTRYSVNGVVHAWVGQILLNCDVFKR